jgi:hypothetical protein
MRLLSTCTLPSRQQEQSTIDEGFRWLQISVDQGALQQVDHTVIVLTLPVVLSISLLSQVACLTQQQLM